MIPLLRDYQSSMTEEVRENFRRGVNSQLLVSPTGSGKTTVFSYIAASAVERRKRVGILCHRTELLEQIGASLGSFEVPYGVVAPQHATDQGALVQVASVFTLARRLALYQQFDLLIIDEAHHAIPGSTWDEVIAANPQAKVLGVTATPERLSGSGLGEIFQAMVLGPSTAALIAQGWLSRYTMYAPAIASVEGVHTRMGEFVRGELEAALDKPRITGDAVAHYLRLARGRRTICFCVSIAHAVHVAEQFRSEGIAAAHIDGKMDRAERAGAIEDFKAGRVLVLTSCDLVSEGFDVPSIECAILLRPTQSLGLYLQQVGRALRICDGKRDTLILDHAGNSMRHGLPDDERQWSLDATARSKRDAKKDDAVPVKTCGHCFAAVRAHVSSCPHCGWAFPVQARAVEQVAGDLVEVDPEAARRAQRVEQAMCKTLPELIAHGRKRGMAHPEAWARRVMHARGMKTIHRRAA